MTIDDATKTLLQQLAGKPGHDEVKAGFLDLLVREFDIERGNLNFEVRQPVIAGRLDALVGRTIFEAKRDLDKEWADVERKMPGYLSDRERQDKEPYVGIASDGRRWVALELAEGKLATIKETILDPEKGEAFLAWLDGALALKSSLPPDALTIRAELGHDSFAFHRVDTELRALWAKLQTVPAEALKRQLWAELLKQVYGRDVENDALWFQHSYLVIVAKCIALAVMHLPEDDPKKLLSGEAFTAAGINGAVESDFFDWVVADPDGEALVRRIIAHVRRFRLNEVESDVLKILYESLIDRDERHGLGEYYTPDWLAAKVVRHAVDRPLEQNVLDPACGSGTFLFHAVRRVLAEAEDAGIPRGERAAEAAQRVTGMDIHPVAVIIARVTYLLALAPALVGRNGGFGVPVYLGDAMQLGIAQTINDTRLEIRVPPPPAGAELRGEIRGREVLSFPETFCRDPGLFDKAIERMRTGSLADLTRDQIETSLETITDRHLLERPMTQIERASGKRPEGIDDEHRRAIRDLGATYEIFDRLRREGRDTIWSYVARNLSRPLSLATRSGWAHVLVGNPPWVAFRHMSGDLQKRFKALSNGERVFVGGKFATQNDLCALFTVRASHLYLRPAGRLAFVLPLAVLSRGQFEKFRRGSFASYCIAWDEAWTMDDSVTPLFPVPACTVFGRKRALAQKMPDKVRAYSGWLPMRDAPEEMADERLTVRENVDAPTEAIFTGGSPYRNMFSQGAILVPRMLCLVDHKAMGRLGADPSAPMVMSKRSSLEKEPWKSLDGIENRVESRFLRPIYLGESILPYRIFQPFEGVIPFESDRGPLDAQAAHNLENGIKTAAGYKNIADWMQIAEEVWNTNRSDSTTISLIEQFDYYGKLSSQFPIPNLRVVYATSGSLLAACIIRDHIAVVDSSLYWCAANDEDEAAYLIAILNSEIARVRAENFQARGQFGARHFHKVIWNLPIPRYNAKLKLHRDLAEAGAQAEEKAAMVILKEDEKFQRARKRVRDALIADGIAGEIEKLVENLLGPAPSP
ncbi:MAG: N-6 DNA methylase [Sphingopyxis sp.]|nr:N-6 DNA methylase [Sphingopyxis sp.]